MLKIITKIFFVLVFFVIYTRYVYAQEKQVNVYFFWGDGCPHCAGEKPFLDKLEKKYPEVEIYNYEIWGSKKNRELLSKVGEKLKIKVSGVPFTVIGDIPFVGFGESLTSVQMEERVQYCILNKCPDSVAGVAGLTERGRVSESEVQAYNNKLIPEKINFPVIGEISTKNLSLPVFTIVLGALDGFNPCAMWTLIFLISLLLGMRDKKRRWILGTVFIATSALVYFLFMSAWLNLILFMGFIVWVRILIGLVAIGGGVYNLKEFFVSKNNGCKVTGEEKRKVVFEKLKSITQQKKFLIALGGIIILAFAVNLVELLCSIGLPVVFTQVLALSNLPKWQYYSYMLLYIFVFMIDDLFVFFTAMLTLEITGISTKYSRISHLFGGVLILIVGLLLLFRPELLMFG